LRRFNQLDRDAAAELLEASLNVDRWVAIILDRRPYRRVDDLFEVARDAAFPLTGAELEAALAHRSTPPLMRTAERGEPAAEARFREQLADGVRTYQQRFGRPFLIGTTGRLPAQILVQLWDRLSHDPDTEDQVLASQLRQLALDEVANKVVT